MNSQSRFGITISCYPGDVRHLRGCLASIREHIPALPICLIPHGAVDTAEFRDLYDVFVLAEQDVDDRLRAQSYGYGLTKMVAFWHSPFDHFLHIDPDTICWGDITSGLPWTEYDFIHNEQHEEITPFIQRTQYFDPEKINVPFEWKGKPFFNSGCFVARRGIFELGEYLDIVTYMKRHEGSIFLDQGIINFLLFRSIERDGLKTRSWPLQAVVPVIATEELKARFRFHQGKPVVAVDDRRIIHWAGAKPNVFIRRHRFQEPMTYYREKHLRARLDRSKNNVPGAAMMGLSAEELRIWLNHEHKGRWTSAAGALGAFMLNRLIGKRAIGSPAQQ
jgi:hypothetical protein